MDQTLAIRISRPDDLAALDALFARVYPKLLKRDYAPSVLVTALPIISRAQPALLRSGTFYVAETAERVIVGAGGWTPRGKSGVGDVRHVVTDDRHLRRGVARAILTRAIEEASLAGLKRMNCQATRTAVDFYRAMGFSSEGEISVELRPGILFPAVRMSRTL